MALCIVSGTSDSGTLPDRRRRRRRTRGRTAWGEGNPPRPAPPTVGPDGTRYIQLRAGATGQTQGLLAVAPVVGADGTAYVAVQQVPGGHGEVLALGTHGTERPDWPFTTGGSPVTAITGIEVAPVRPRQAPDFGAAWRRPAIREGPGPMFQTWWYATMDARRALSLLVGVVGLVLVALSVAASSVLLTLDGPLLMGVVSPALGAAAGGYVAHRSSGPRRARLWAFAYGVSSGALIAGMFATAALLRPTVEAMPGLADTWAGLFGVGCLLDFVGALLWERDPRRRRVAAWLLLAVWLIAGGVVVGVSRGPWAWLGAMACLVGFGLLVHAVGSSATLDKGSAVRRLWPSGSVGSDPTHPRTS